jgi:hypothetical protein
MPDNEHTAAALWNSKELSVKHSVGEPIPALPQRPKEGAKIPSSVARQHAGDVLPNQPLGAILCSDGKIGEHEISARVIKSFAKSRD